MELTDEWKSVAKTHEQVNNNMYTVNWTNER